MDLCLCKGITEAHFLAMIARHAGSCARVKPEMGLDDDCCGRCAEHLDDMLGQFMAEAR